MATQLSAETLSPIAYNQIPVITTELLARLYSTQRQRITNNFNRNKSRFIEGKHYFVAKGEKLESLKNSLRDFQTLIADNVRKLILWTERGAARHAKMLETDQAWEVFEKLEDCYFTKKVSNTSDKTHPGKLTPEQQAAIKELVKSRAEALPEEKRAKATITMWSALKSHFKCSYKDIGENDFTEALSLTARIPLEGEYIPVAMNDYDARILCYQRGGIDIHRVPLKDHEMVMNMTTWLTLAKRQGWLVFRKDEFLQKMELLAN